MDLCRHCQQGGLWTAAKANGEGTLGFVSWKWWPSKTLVIYKRIRCLRMTMPVLWNCNGPWPWRWSGSPIPQMLTALVMRDRWVRAPWAVRTQIVPYQFRLSTCWYWIWNAMLHMLNTTNTVKSSEECFARFVLFYHSIFDTVRAINTSFNALLPSRMKFTCFTVTTSSVESISIRMYKVDWNLVGIKSKAKEALAGAAPFIVSDWFSWFF